MRQTKSPPPPTVDALVSGSSQIVVRFLRSNSAPQAFLVRITIELAGQLDAETGFRVSQPAVESCALL
jgi:hypothetical protein